MDLVKPLPSNLDAERTVLGACMTFPEAALEAASRLRPEEFFLPQHQVIFGAILKLTAQGVPVDLVTMVEVLTSSKTLESAGGTPYVAALLDGIPRLANLAHHAAIISRKAKLRSLIKCAHNIQQQAFETEDEALIEMAVSQILGIASGGRGPIVAREWKDVAASAMAEFSNAFHNPDLAKRINFGLTDLDEATGGLRKKDLVEIVAPTSNGKTLLAGQAAFQADRDGFKVLFFSAEMPAEQIAMREIAYQAGVPFYYARRPEKATTDELHRLEAASKQSCGVRIVDRDITPARIWAMAEAAKRTHGLDFVIVDYDQLVIEAGMNPNSDDDNIFRHQRAFVFTAKRLAERLDICFLFLSQLRKLSPAVLKGAQPHLDDIWGDSSVRNTPHVILWASREYFTSGMNKEFERKAKVYVLKSRNDRTGIVDLEFDPERLRFSDALPTEADSIPEPQWQKYCVNQERA